MIAAQDVPASLVLWTAGITAAGSLLAALVGGLISYLATAHVERQATAREREARQAEQRSTDERHHLEFQRTTITDLQQCLTEMWGAGSDIFHRKLRLLRDGRVTTIDGVRKVDEADIGESLLDELRQTRIRAPMLVERLEDQSLRDACWEAMHRIAEATTIWELTDADRLRNQMGDSVQRANERLGEGLRALALPDRHR